MKHLERCSFCNTIISKNEIGIKDKDLGTMCKKCFDWMQNEFLPIWRSHNGL